MTGTIVHVAFAGMIAAAFLGEAFDRRALAIVLAVTAFPDIDSFVPLFAGLGHRTVFHNFVIPFLATVVLWADLRRENSWLRESWGPRGVRIAWVSIVCYAVAAVGLDMVSGVVNPLWPIHDQFYALEGKLVISDQRGIVQTFIETGGDGGSGSVPSPEPKGSSTEVNVSTGVDPDPSDTKTDPERIFPIVRAGWQLVILLAGTAVTAARFRVAHSLSER